MRASSASNMRASESAPSTPRAKERTMRPPSCLADLPIPTPPPMANLFMTSRFDLPTRGAYSFRRLLHSGSSEFGHSSTIGRSGSFDISRLEDRETYEGLYRRSEFNDQPRSYAEQPRSFGGTPILNRRIPTCPDYIVNHQETHDFKKENPRKYLSTDSDLSRELEEVKYLSQELHHRFGDYRDIEETDSGVLDSTPTLQKAPYYNDHYISDIDENEEVKRFCFSYDVSEQKCFSSDRCGYSGRTLPPTPSVKFSKTGRVPSPQLTQRSDGFRGSLSSLKSSDFGGLSPLLGRVADGSHTQRIVKTPMRPVVKIARVR